MRLDCGKTNAERHAELINWHKWFAWYPVRVGSHDCRWLETINRKGTFVRDWDGSWYFWEYKL